ncbi:MAG: hypothetical protein J6M17_00620 [Ruminococcus sp.]|nr:hypothetical protein [Ruminococcus sp.]
MSERNVTVKTDTEQGKTFVGIGASAFSGGLIEIIKEVAKNSLISSYSFDKGQIILGIILLALGLFLMILGAFIISRPDICAADGELICKHGKFPASEIDYIKVGAFGGVRMSAGGKVRSLCDMSFIGCGELFMWAEESGIEVRDSKDLRKDVLFLMKAAALAGSFLPAFFLTKSIGR